VERSGARAEAGLRKIGQSGAERERGAAERERSGERRSEKSSLMQSGKTFRSTPLTCSGCMDVTANVRAIELSIVMTLYGFI